MKCKLRIFDADDESVCLSRWIEATQVVVRAGQLPVWHFNYQVVKVMQRPDSVTMSAPLDVCPVGYALVNEAGKEFQRCWFDRRVFLHYGSLLHISYNCYGRLTEPDPMLLLPAPPPTLPTLTRAAAPFSETLLTATGARTVIRTGVPPLPDQPLAIAFPGAQ